MDKKKLLELIAKKEARKAALDTKSSTCEDVTELRSMNNELTDLNGEIAELRSIIATIEDPPQPGTEPEKRGSTQQPVGGFKPLGTFNVTPSSEQRGIDKVLAMSVSSEEEKAEMRSALFACEEYRSGYLKNLAGKGLNDVEKRALSTAAGSGGAAVPTTTYDLILKRLTQTSAIFGLIKKSYIPGNVALPVADPQVAAGWTDSAPAALMSGTTEDDTIGSVTLGAFPLSKFAAVKGQLLIMAIDAFETYIVSAIADQLAIALENSILNGTGLNQPSGILTGVTWNTKNSLTFAKSGLGYDDLVDTRALLGLYRSNAVWIVNNNTEAQLFKIKTTQGQPLFTQNPITGLISNPLGIPYIVDYYLPDDTILCANLDYYYMNINQNPIITADDSAGFLSTSRIYRGTMFLDAKPALNQAFVKLTKSST
ncbi:phage major capsid protein, HK97 family [Propionispira arboris]|uniref:Phage major capsid protein, HK97 family n=1 Tax=Propionispira arboris TaxID=84035 RepID=A0A1H7A3R3_9FIRM|nr:phage major capsid protein [Propionispira arboris]SEJ60221.1 phage major capsid protein, HK97 family [Propionispira arboris]